jgi:hypothetical protein
MPMASSPEIVQTVTSVPVIILNYLHLHINFHLHFPRKPDESSHSYLLSVSGKNFALSILLAVFAGPFALARPTAPEPEQDLFRRSSQDGEG